MSTSCFPRNWRRLISSAASADQPVGPIQYLRRDREPQSFRHLQVDGELDLRVHLYGDLGRLRPLKDLVHQARCLPTRAITVWTVAGQRFVSIDPKRAMTHGWDALLPGVLTDVSGAGL